ncbi:hypothetical protein SAMN05444336_101248 [Albimonas donghaensis]|uniref:PRTase-CE domain-containing protein n=1 Tax=Albimonas donghaensis TaxID=356660 RepID=A0A1H2R5Z3_9RHOB|nr:ATP-binding protein [Albimonas donghaensis]SDW14886.1 hypothetical protein SAMN05444336_101248 [Albimonas donghaensis]
MLSMSETEIHIDYLAVAEKAVRDGNTEDARLALRKWLCIGIDELGPIGSLSSILNSISASSPNNRKIPPVILRFLATEGVILADGWKGEVQRSIVSICETAAPDLCKFLKIDPRMQNFKKFEALQGAHSIMCGNLDALTTRYGDIESVVAAQKSITAPLNHGQVRAYCSPFGLNEIRAGIDATFSKLKAVTQSSASFVEDYADCRRALDQCNEVAQEISSFVTIDYVIPFLEMVDRLLNEYVASTKARFYSDLNSEWIQPSIAKKHPLHEVGREFSLSVPFRNDGPGMAIDVRATMVLSSDDVVLQSQVVPLGNVMPGEFSLVLPVMVLAPCKSFSGMVELDWAEVGAGSRKRKSFDFDVIAQAHDIDWSRLTYWTPYSTDVAKGSEFIGRLDKVEHLASKLLRTPMEPFYITGQKRVGKTSLVRAATEFAEANTVDSDIRQHFILWGDVAHADPAMALRQIGESIEEFITNSLPDGVSNVRHDYAGSLSPLLKVFDRAQSFLPNTKFVVTIDEFDEIPQELYLHGNLAETFFANLRSISRRDNVCLVLVGGENMAYVMSRQGQKLNNFVEVSLSYFSRETEWSDFQQMVRIPTSGKLSWHDDAVAEVFNISNGNPYYAKLVCAGVAKRSIAARDADITRLEVRQAADEQISSLGSNSFAHLWQDGIPKSPEEREPDVLRRSRVLVAAARCLRDRLSLTLSNLADKKVSGSLSAAEIQHVLNDLHMRQILEEEVHEYRFVLPIFGSWLADVGASKLVADALSEELAQSILAEENAALVRSEEIVSLSRSWPVYRGKSVTTDEIRAWYQQVESIKEQRLLFELLKKVKFFSEAHIRERLETVHSFVRSAIPPEVQTKRKQRRNDIAVVYVDGEGKSGSAYATMYAEQNRISARAVFSASSFARQIKLHIENHGVPAAVVVVDDIAATGNSLEGNLRSFASEHSEVIGHAKLRAISIVATQSAYDRLTRSLSDFEVDADFRACEILNEQHHAFPNDKSGWQSEDTWDRAKALCEQLGTYIYPKNPLGFGGMGLLVVFPTTVPNNTLPILHSRAKASSVVEWSPLFERVTH